MVRTDDGWLLGDAVPEPADGVYWRERVGGQVLMPARSIVDEVWPQCRGLGRSKVLRSAVASYARSRWGPGAAEVPWQPSATQFDEERPVVEALLGHAFWARLEVIGSLLHLAVPRHDAATTVDLAVRFTDGQLGLLAIWSPHLLLRPEAPWAELGAAVAAMADAGIPIAKAVVVWASVTDGGPAVTLEARSGDEALGCWIDLLDFARARRRHFPGEVPRAA